MLNLTRQEKNNTIIISKNKFVECQYYYICFDNDFDLVLYHTYHRQIFPSQ